MRLNQIQAILSRTLKILGRLSRLPIVGLIFDTPSVNYTDLFSDTNTNTDVFVDTNIDTNDDNKLFIYKYKLIGFYTIYSVI